ncbi:MAG TPA: Fe-S-containing protein [Terriglobales bacterium]|nr:Fe-S-containing protein [Terriglobales bacterium]
MLEQFVITLREGIEAALIVAIALIYLRKIERSDLNRVVYAALAAALLVSLGGAIVLARLHIYEDDRMEGWLMLVAAIFVATMVYWMDRTAKHLRREIEEKLGQLLDASVLGLFFFIFFMVLREGMETVLILSAVSLSTSSLLAWFGGVLGLALAVLFAIAFIKGSVRVNLGRFFRITSVILIFIAAQLLVTGVHELSEAGVLPSSRQEMALVGPIVRNDFFFFIVILGLAGILLLREKHAAAAAARSRVAVAVAAGGGGGGEGAPPLSPAQRRKLAWSARRERLWHGLAYATLFLCMVAFAGEYVYARSARALSPATPVEAHAGLVTIPAAKISDGYLHRYEAITPAGAVRFFAIRRPDGSLAVALDACQICGAKGYYQQGSQVVCRNCDSPINIASIGAIGGCNPVPLAYQLRNGAVEIRLAALASQAGLFRK